MDGKFPQTLLLAQANHNRSAEIRHVIERHGCAVVAAHSTEDVVSQVADTPNIEMVLLDVDLTGPRVAADIVKRLRKERDLPVVFLVDPSDLSPMKALRPVARYGFVMRSADEILLVETIAVAFDLYQTNRRLKERNELIETVLNHLPIGLAVHDTADGTTLFMNRRFEEIYGWPRSEMKDVAAFFRKVYPDPDYRASIERRVLEDISSGDPDRMTWDDIAATGQDGTVRFIHAKDIPITGGQQIISTVIDTTARRRAEEHNRFLAHLLRSVRQAVIATDAEGITTFVNEYAEWLYGYSSTEAVGKPASSVMGINRTDGENQKVRDALAADGTWTEETTAHHRDGRAFEVRVVETPLFDDTGTLSGRIGVSDDATRLRETERRLKQALLEKDALMKELNHRVKNNLIMIGSLVSLKDAAIGGSPDLSDIRHQIDAVRIVHEKLHHAADVRRLSLPDYLEDLLHSVFALAPTTNVRAAVHAPDIIVSTRSALSIGLIVNELATNTVKHGAPETGDHTFTVAIQISQGDLVLVVENDGPPIPNDVDLNHPHTLGLRLVRTLVGQLSGTITLRRSPSPQFTMRFPLTAVSDAPESVVSPSEST